MYNMVIRTRDDIPTALSYTKKILRELNYSKIDEQHILVCVSELTKNVIKHSGVSGTFKLYFDEKSLYIMVSDKGKGIDNLSEILEGKHRSSSNGLGLGLLGVKRLMDDFRIATHPGKGVTVIATKKR